MWRKLIVALHNRIVLFYHTPSPFQTKSEAMSQFQSAPLPPVVNPIVPLLISLAIMVLSAILLKWTWAYALWKWENRQPESKKKKKSKKSKKSKKESDSSSSSGSENDTSSD
jgi:cytoskeletal protein RodZ